MQTQKAAQLRAASKGTPCSHPHLDKEYHLGTATGDYVCTTCGMVGWGSAWNKKQGPTQPKPDSDKDS